jgi:hypothetical protein
MSSHSLLLCALAAAAAASNPTPNPNLRFFSVWSGGAGGVSDPISGIAPSFVNFLFDVSSTAAFPKLQERGFGPSLLHVREVLFMDRHAPTRGLRPDYKERWNATLEQLRPLIASGAAMGVFLGDELCWDCVSHAELTTAAELVRATLPDLLPAAVAERAGQARPVIYYNEAFPVLDDAAMWNATCGPAVALASSGGGYPNVPPAIDWVSLDYYPNEGTFAGARRIYREQLYPRMGEAQRVLFVPPAYTCTTADPSFADHFCCNNNTRDGPNPPCHGDCEAALSLWARQSYDWARSDERFVGLNPWHWSQQGDPPPSRLPPNTSMDPGLKYTPKLRALYEKIGAEIASGRLGEV